MNQYDLHLLLIESVQSFFPIHANDMEQIVIRSKKDKPEKGLFTCNVALYISNTRKESPGTVAKRLAPEINKRLKKYNLSSRTSGDGYIYIGNFQ